MLRMSGTDQTGPAQVKPVNENTKDVVSATSVRLLCVAD